MKITPAHDFNDYEVGRRHKLPMINILTFDGDIRESAQVYDTNGEASDVYDATLPEAFRNMERFAARKAIVAAVDELGLLEEVKAHDLTVPYGDRGGVVIEPMLTDQWYVRTAPLAKVAVEAVENGDIQFVPKQYENMYFSRMRDIQDWCISRQLWWGHRIPARYDEEGNVYVGRSEEEVRAENQIDASIALRQDEDVLDTGSPLVSGPSLPRLAGKHRSAAHLPPDQRAGKRLRHHLLLDRAHDHADHALHEG